jgi:hypothetical protein
LHLGQACFSILLWTRVLQVLFSLLDIGFSTLLPHRSASSHEINPFLSFLIIIVWVWIPSSWLGLEVLHMGSLPCLLIKSWGVHFQIPTWLVIHLWVKGPLRN